MAGSEQARSRRFGWTPVLLVAALVAAPHDARAATEAILRVGLTGPDRLPVGVSFGDGAVTLDLPPGAAFSTDFEADSGGLIRDARVTRLEGGRSLLELTLGGGLVDKVSVEADAVVLTIRSRGSAPGPGTQASDAYRLGPEDRIQISVNGQPDMTRQVVVDKTGTVAAPLLGEVTAAGLTTAELTDRVTELLARDYLVDPKVDIQVVEYRSQSVVVTGEVRNPGRMALRGGTTLKEALAEVGGFGPDAGEQIEIARVDASGVVATLRIDRAAYERGESNPRLADGDLINIPKATFVFVNGEVRAPGRIKLERGLTLLRAIAVSGGLTEWANAKAVRVLQEGNTGEGQEYNLRDVESGKAPDPELHGGDVVVVRRRFL